MQGRQKQKPRSVGRATVTFFGYIGSERTKPATLWIALLLYAKNLISGYIIKYIIKVNRVVCQVREGFSKPFSFTICNIFLIRKLLNPVQFSHRVRSFFLKVLILYINIYILNIIYKKKHIYYIYYIEWLYILTSEKNLYVYKNFKKTTTRFDRL